jgi:DNA polymerase I-like protein with 3'-5' exonuclease and polymerase domains/uracil-DNA glycosylase
VRRPASPHTDELNTIRDVSARGYVPEDHGCECERCPLQHVRHEGRFVPPEIRPSTSLLVVAEAPGKVEEELNRPLVGPSGKELERALLAAGATRQAVSLTNALLCKPDGGNLEKYLVGLRRRNKAEKGKGRAEPTPSPLTCCAGRLSREAARAPGLLLLGAAARRSIYGATEAGDKKLMSSRGFPTVAEVDGRQIPTLSTVHPAFVLRALRWRPIFQGDVAKALRMVRGALRWAWPETVLCPSPEALRAALARIDASRWPPAYDTETNGLDTRTARLRCLGIGNPELVVVVPFRSVEENRRDLGVRAFYTPEEERLIRATLREWFGRRDGIVCAHNEQYDRLVLRHQLPDIRVERRVLDTVIAHHVACSEYPHDLGFVEAQLTDAEQHKAVRHDRWESDVQLHTYNARDVAVTSYAAERLSRTKALVEQRRVFTTDMFLSGLCRELHSIGIAFDVAERDRHHALLTQRMSAARDAFRLAAQAAVSPGQSRDAVAKINPGSPTQVRQWLYSFCGVEYPEDEDELTASGDPSVSRDVLFDLIDRGVSPQTEEAIQCLIDYRMAQKLRGTYCTVEPDDDGRVRPTWNPHVVVSGRLSTSRPNVLNVQGTLRSMYKAEQGHALVFCDKAQLELRLAAWLAQDEELIQAFLAGSDVHRVNAAALLQKTIEDVTDEDRRFCKQFTYAVQYKAGATKAWRMLKNFRDDKGQRPFRDIKKEAVEVLHRRWGEARAAIGAYHEANVESWRKVGYIDEPLDGRRRYFLDGEDREAMANLPIQSAAAADVNAAMRRIVGEFPWGFAGQCTGMVHYNYDSVGIEVPEHMAVNVGVRVVELMTSSIGDMPLPVDFKIGPNWYALTEYVQRDRVWVPKPKKAERGKGG